MNITQGLERATQRNLVLSICRLVDEELTKGRALDTNNQGDIEAWDDAIEYLKQSVTALNDVGCADLDEECGR